MSTTYDEAFPLPDPDFLWIHDLTYVPEAAPSVITDPGTGRWHYAPGASVQFTGYISQADRRTQDRAASQGIVCDAVALMSHADGELLDPLTAEYAELVCDATSRASRWLWGRYSVSQVRPNASHLRLILTRIVGDKPSHAP